MNLPNSYFEDFPIEFKQINPEDFSKVFKIEKTTLELEARSYLNDVVQKEMKIQRKNTVVINTPVRNGKSYAFIFNLWNWKNVIHKNFIISATFSEGSKVVVEYLAELTDRKIQIIESDRKRNSQNESKLFLHYSSVHNFTNETPEIKDTILEILKRGKNIDILSYSKVLAKSIIADKALGGKLKEKFGEINDCTS